jgi:hypothetical protein
MKVLMTCLECAEARTSDAYEIVASEYNDSGLYQLTCDNGHTTRCILQEQRWEVLSNVGVFALQDGYYREAVASYTSCIERFYEFCIRVLLSDIPAEEFQRSWKEISSQSERQLGAFTFLWLRTFGLTPQLLPSTRIEFRNRVIHKGYIPSRDEAVEYCSEIYRLVRTKIEYLKSEKSPEIQQVVLEHMHEGNKQVAGTATMSIPTALCLTRAMDAKFEEACAILWNSPARERTRFKRGEKTDGAL